MMPIYKDQTPSVPQLAEFKSHNPNFIEEVPGDPRFNEIANKAEIGLWTGAQAQDADRGQRPEGGLRRAERALGESEAGTGLLSAWVAPNIKAGKFPAFLFKCY